MSDSTNNRESLPDALPEALVGRVPTLAVIAMPADTNAHGNIFGGWIMSQMDLASAQKAIEVTGQSIVTRVATISFEKPANVGDKVCLFTEVGRIGTTSITIHVDVWALRRASHRYEKVGHGEFVFVAIDASKNKTAIIIQKS